jgi:hypothetical protein
MIETSEYIEEALNYDKICTEKEMKKKSRKDYYHRHVKELCPEQKKIFYGNLNPEKRIKYRRKMKEMSEEEKNKRNKERAERTRKLRKQKNEQMKQKIGIATFLIEERLNIHVSLSSHMKLATVRYFDENEDITGYDHEYNLLKLKHWTANHDVQDFFFMQPIQNLGTLSH